MRRRELVLSLAGALTAAGAERAEQKTMFVGFGPDDVKSASTKEVSPGIMLDFDTQGRVIGIEVLDVSERMAAPKAAA
jgi:uncharacterized protein YuzE